MCSRQQGDLCNPRALCDPKKELFCDKPAGNETGVCKARVHNPCLVDGITYKDGQQFQPDCARVCTCQNGFYGCVSKCPQESQRPSDSTCHKPRLLPVPGKCCKEWTCEKLDAAGAGGSILDGTRGLESDSLILQRPLFYLTTTKATTTTTTSTVRPYCRGTTSRWSPCSATCDAGVSVRIVTDQVTCATRQERRICLLRPCGTIVNTEQGRDKCTPTTRSEGKMHVRFMDCVSVRQYRLKWCTTCRAQRCCYPKRTRTRTMHFTCTGGTRETLQFMWIKKCRCDRRCYRQDRKRRGRGGGGGKKKGKGKGKGKGGNNKRRRRRGRGSWRRKMEGLRWNSGS
ncbi:CCN family member 2-like isoform X1 [Babylonia areolata]|uniref:CCN family member 2-like isoform X1 n=1 Tax=Babylonia areolata TaxID=304850 RepID=UPI003FD3478B